MSDASGLLSVSDASTQALLAAARRSDSKPRLVNAAMAARSPKVVVLKKSRLRIPTRRVRMVQAPNDASRPNLNC